MNFNLIDRTILLTIGGSHAYGLNTSSSDIDVKGVAVPTKEYFLGYFNRFEQADKSSHLDGFLHLFSTDERQVIAKTKLEGSIYDIRKFTKLAADCNPNILDVLFGRDQDIRLDTPSGRLLRENRDLFLSKKARWTFSGYAMSQLKRIETHRRYLLNPPSHNPTRSEYNLPDRAEIPKEQFNAAMDAVKKKINSWEIDYGELDEGAKLYIERQISDFLAELTVTANEKFAAAARSIGYDENFIHLLQREREYKVAKTQWAQYQEWKNTRNPARAALEEKYGFDCYSDDTEFLTEYGWKKFDDIKLNEKLATVYIGKSLTHRKFGRIEYQIPTSRFDGIINGDMYHLCGYHIDTLVTPNHKMLIRKVERKSEKTFEWEMCEAANLPDTFEVMMAPEPKCKAYKSPSVLTALPIPEITFMRLLGWYISDGTCTLRKGKIKDIRISQKKGGKLCQGMTKFSKKYKEAASCSLYKYENKGRKNSFRVSSIIEYVLSVRNKLIRETIYRECGHSKNKRIPRWVFKLSKRLKEAMLDGAIAGDGTVRSIGSIIYYSSSEQLANDIQELAMSCGYETSRYGPYAFGMYQVHINKKAPKVKRLIRSKNLKKIPVHNQRFVCFTVPNGTLVTRRNGHVGIHGNCKHAVHLVRLLRMCREILTDGIVNVWRPDAEELLAIRGGAWSYEKLIEFADAEDKAMAELYDISTLSRSPDHKSIDKLCIDVVEGMLK